jgi:HEAT repeat protein
MTKRVPLAAALFSCLAATHTFADTTGTPAPPAAVQAEPSPFEWVGPVTPIQRSIAECLRESRRTQPDAMAPLLKRIVDLGPAAVDGSLAILLQGRVPRSAPEDAPQKLSVPQRGLLLAAVGQLPTKDVRAALEHLLTEQPDPSRARAAVDVFGVVGTGKDLRRLAPLFVRDESGALDHDDKQVLRAAYVKILLRDEAAIPELAALLAGKDDEVGQQVLLAFGERGDARALRVVFESIRSRPTLAQTALSQLPRLASSPEADVRAEVAAWLRVAADPRRIEWTRAVYGAVAAFDEGDAMNELIEALDGEELALRSAAHVALRGISGMTFPHDARRWRTWYETERAWFDSDRPRLTQKMRNPDAAAVVEALREYAAHKLWKSALTSDLEPLLARSEPELRALACREIGRLRAPAAARLLTLALEDPVPGVRKAAEEALRALSGSRTLPAPAGAGS